MQGCKRRVSAPCQQSRAGLKAQRLVFQDVEPGGSANYLFLLSVEQSTGHLERPRKLTGALGKLELRWRSSSAALGRLQTQQIMASAAAQTDLSVLLLSLPQASSQQLGPCLVSDDTLSNLCKGDHSTKRLSWL